MTALEFIDHRAASEHLLSREDASELAAIMDGIERLAQILTKPQDAKPPLSPEALGEMILGYVSQLKDLLANAQPAETRPFQGIDWNDWRKGHDAHARTLLRALKHLHGAQGDWRKRLEGESPSQPRQQN